jgi:hypothetical protein
MKTKTFDCVKMKDEAQRRRADKLQGFSDQQRLDFYRNAQEELLRRRERLRKQQADRGNE